MVPLDLLQKLDMRLVILVNKIILFTFLCLMLPLKSYKYVFNLVCYVIILVLYIFLIYLEKLYIKIFLYEINIIIVPLMKFDSKSNVFLCGLI